jgi:transcriptional regulator with XRE-family HTH domain
LTSQRESENEIFGRHLRELRLARHLTQPDLAARCNSTVPHISNMERGVLAPSFNMLLRLANGLECRVADLVAPFDHHLGRSSRSRKN